MPQDTISPETSQAVEEPFAIERLVPSFRLPHYYLDNLPYYAGNEGHVLMCMWRFASSDPNLQVTMSVDAIAQKTGLTHVTVRKSLRALVQFRCLIVIRCEPRQPVTYAVNTDASTVDIAGLRARYIAKGGRE